MGYSFKREQKVLQLLFFQKILDESNCKSNKIWADGGSIQHITKEILLLLKTY